MRKNYVKETYGSREEWLKARGFGGSSASAILGKNPYMSALELYKACVHPNPDSSKQTDSMAYGTACEPIIRKLFAIDYPNYRIHTPRNHEMYRRKDKEYLTATVDGILTDTITGKKGVLEIKTHDMRGRLDAAEWTGKVPDNYYIQMLHYMMVMGDMEFAILYAKIRYYSFSENGEWRLERSELRAYDPIWRKDVARELEYLERRETEFYERYVLVGKIPPDYVTFG